MSNFFKVGQGFTFGALFGGATSAIIETAKGIKDPTTILALSGSMILGGGLAVAVCVCVCMCCCKTEQANDVENQVLNESTHLMN